jgi:hypothetical protein
MEGYEYGRYGMPAEIWRRRTSNRLRVFLGIVGVGFAVGLAVVVGQRLSGEAMAVLAGTVCGVAASIPTSLLIVWVTRRRQEQASTQSTGTYPPVIVVQPPAQNGMPSGSQAGYLGPYVPPAQREFNVVGGGVEEVRHGRYQ